MLTKTQKIEFVKERKKLLKNYKVVGIVQLKSIPDKLLQTTKNRMRTGTRFIMGRKSLLSKILETDEHTKKLVSQLTDTSAIILSNDDPFELYASFKSNSLKLAAKPGQMAPNDVNITAGETGVQPGQTVTDLKGAGIDVQIQKGKVVIAKDKVLVKQGEVITASVAKALHTLEIMPFEAILEPSSLLIDGMIYTKKVLGINRETTTQDIVLCFINAMTLSIEAKIINAYTINTFIARAYNAALSMGLEAKALDSGIIDLLIANAASQAAILSKLEAPSES